MSSHKILALLGLLFCISAASAAPVTIWISPTSGLSWSANGCTEEVPCLPDTPLQFDSSAVTIYVTNGTYDRHAELELRGSSTILVLPASTTTPTDAFDKLHWNFACVACTASASVSFNSKGTNSNINFNHIPSARFTNCHFTLTHITYTNTSKMDITNTHFTHSGTDPILDHVSAIDHAVPDVYSLSIISSFMSCYGECGPAMRLSLLVAQNYPIHVLIDDVYVGNAFTAFSVFEIPHVHYSNYTITRSTIELNGPAAIPAFAIESSSGSSFYTSLTTISAIASQSLVRSAFLADQTIFADSTITNLTVSGGPSKIQFLRSVQTGAFCTLRSEGVFTCQDSIVHCAMSSDYSTPVIFKNANLQVSNCSFLGNETSSVVLFDSVVSSLTRRTSMPSGASIPDLIVDQLSVVANASVTAIMEVRKRILAMRFVDTFGYSNAISDVTLYGASDTSVTQNYFWRLSGPIATNGILLRSIAHLQFDLGNGAWSPASITTFEGPFLQLSNGKATDIGFTWGSSFAPNEASHHFLTMNTPIAFLPAWGPRVSQSTSTPRTYSFIITETNTTRREARRGALDSELSASSSAVAVSDLYYVAQPSSCPLPAPLPLGVWTCIGQQWVYTGDLGGPGTVVVVGSPVLVTGNFTPPSVTFNGLNSTIQVLGCASLPSEIFVMLTLSEYLTLRENSTLYATLIESNCTDSKGQQININVQSANKKSCEKIKGTLLSEGQKMTATFDINSSGCKTWWIILVSVLCGVAFIVVVLVLIFTLVPSARRLVRPYSKKRAAPTS